MNKFAKKIALLVGGIVAADLLIPGVGSDELALQAGLVAVCVASIYFR
jgi:hypothetical protein